MMEFETKSVRLMMCIWVRGCSWVFAGVCFQFLWFETRRARVREEPLEPITQFSTVQSAPLEK